ncbi:Fc.00g077570.m01.CDS01 [Cosmosporella sp. VM-42]
MEDDEYTTSKMGEIKLEEGANGAHVKKERSTSIPTPNDSNDGSRSPAMSQNGVKSRSGSADTPSSTRPPKLTRKASQKKITREPLLFNHLPNVTSESRKAFQLIPDCLYGSKHLGSTDNDALDCDCNQEWRDGENFACGEDSDCINRATKMECSGGGGNCGGGCQNQRFQRKQYANVSVIKTEKKGFGLRADSDLHVNDFVFEYIGEVINEPTFRRRMIQYDDEGIRHFYFMSLNKSEFVDATKKGNLGRFCNHSCNPNCYVDKWVVGDKLRMGIFASRKIQAGEELVFNYNVDRYGADPQPCYCGEPNCVGFIGGKTQTERATKLPAGIVEALGIDGGDGWDTSVAKKPRKKKPEEDDEEYVNSIQPRSLDEEDARKVMAALMQCKEKWIAVKLLERIQRSDEERVVHYVMRMHAYQILKTTLNTFKDDYNVVLQVLSILDQFPRLTRNKIQDSKIEAAIEPLTRSEHDDVATKSKKLLDEWSKLEMAYRIRRRKLDPNAPASNSFEERRGQGREEEPVQPTSKTSSPRTIDAPKGPRNSAPQRNNAFFHNGVRPRRPPFNAPLPQGWFTAKDAAGNTYFYTKQGTTTWQRPTQPAPESTPKAPSKAMQEQLLIQNIINKVTKEGTPKQSVQTPKAADAPAKDSKKDKWRTLPIDKQMKIYENTLFPHVKHVLDKFHHKLPREELKRLGKDVAKKLVASDYKNNRVGDPSLPLSDKQSRKMKKYVQEFLNRALEKYTDHQKRKAARETQHSASATQAPDGKKPEVGSAADSPLDSPPTKADTTPMDDAEDVILSDNNTAGSSGSPDRKRKREVDGVDSPSLTPSDGPMQKRLREDELGEPSPPPPPPPPPESAMEDVMTAEQLALREQEEALVRENEEAQRLEDEANHTKELEQAAETAQYNISKASQELSKLLQDAKAPLPQDGAA